MVDRWIARFWNKIYTGTRRVENVCTAKKPVVCMCLPYLFKFSLDLRKSVSSIVRRSYPQVQLRFVFKPAFRVSSLFRVKDRTPFSLRSCVVYQYPCGGCNATYIGKTKRHLATRISEHWSVSVRTGRPVKSAPFSAIGQHSHNCSPMSVDNFSLLHSSSNEYELGIIEGLCIWKFRPCLNTMQSSGDLHLFT